MMAASSTSSIPSAFFIDHCKYCSGRRLLASRSRYIQQPPCIIWLSKYHHLHSKFQSIYEKYVCVHWPLRFSEFSFCPSGHPKQKSVLSWSSLFTIYILAQSSAASVPLSILTSKQHKTNIRAKDDDHHHDAEASLGLFRHAFIH